MCSLSPLAEVIRPTGTAFQILADGVGRDIQSTRPIRGLIRQVRRNYELRLADAGRDVVAQVRQIGSAHEEDILGALSPAERQVLGALLAKLTVSHDLVPDVHPGYRKLR